MIPMICLSALALGSGPIQQPQLSIKDDSLGAGAAVRSGDVVQVSYSGTLSDGKQFDSSDGKPPFMFLVGAGQVIKGWDQGVVGMKEGGKREITIPPALGYGTNPIGPIPGNSTLHFTITLVKVEPKVQITIVTPGSGSAQSEVGDIAHLHFQGGPKGGKIIFDSTYRNKGAVNILIGERTLPIGFVPALVGMKEGEKRKVIIPAPIAYGSDGIPKTDRTENGNLVKAGSILPPNTDVEFTFELVKLEKPSHSPQG